MNKKSKFVFSTMLGMIACAPLAALADSPTNVERAISRSNHERELRYKPDNTDFMIVNGNNRFNRPIYGSNSAFRIEAGDKPEFGLYMPNMGGNLKIGLIKPGSNSKWLSGMDKIEFSYRPGAAIYTITDGDYLGAGKLTLTIMAMDGQDGLVAKISATEIPSGLSVMVSYGGASNQRFVRDGDLGVSPEDCFELKPEYCTGNKYKIGKEGFSLYYGADQALIAEAMGGTAASAQSNSVRMLKGLFPPGSEIKLVSPDDLSSPLAMVGSKASAGRPAISAVFPLKVGEEYISVSDGFSGKEMTHADLKSEYVASENRREQIASSIIIDTPDPYINTLGGAISIAADALWGENAWQHGAVSWRTPMPGWRVGYAGDVLGWHDKARAHFNSYANSQVKDVPATIAHPSQDPDRNYSRALRQWGTQMYSNGFITRFPNSIDVMHQYDMNLVYIDQLLWHFNWTGDLDYVKSKWDVIESHLAWEKKNFDPDNDGLYDAYGCISSSDALQYNSGGVTHSTAYNYRANKRAAEIAEKIGKNPTQYRKEAQLILDALNKNLWIAERGHWGEYKDHLGRKQVHASAGLWTIYHAIDSDVADNFQAYQATRYVDAEIPRIPVVVKGMKDEGLATLSTTNWFPYTWSVNNVSFAEVAHTSLAYWQAGRYDEAYRLYKGAVIDGMYLGNCPGNLSQLSYYDAARGETHRDFGDPVGIVSRTLVQGLFGISPDYINNRITITPGMPSHWDYASLSNGDIVFDFKRKDMSSTYKIEFKNRSNTALFLNIKAPYDKVAKIMLNGRPAKWTVMADAVGDPMISIESTPGENFRIDIMWAGSRIKSIADGGSIESNKYYDLAVNEQLAVKDIKDPQKLFPQPQIKAKGVSGVVKCDGGQKTFFLQVKQGDMTWWEPVHLNVIKPNYLDQSKNVLANVESDSKIKTDALETVDIDAYFNSSVCDIFKNKYESPRSSFTTLQIPVHGVGHWVDSDFSAEIDDSGLRGKSVDGVFTTPFGLPFRINKDTGKNIVYTSLWDNYPDNVKVPLSGRGRRIYFLLAGSTNHMQSQFTNGVIKISYKDGSYYLLKLDNPTTWCPIEQDYYFDEAAFNNGEYPRPFRVMLSSGAVERNLDDMFGFNGVNDRIIPGGAAVILDAPLLPNKELKEISVEAMANDVVIGLMGITIDR